MCKKTKTRHFWCPTHMAVMKNKAQQLLLNA